MKAYHEIIATNFDKTEVVLGTKPTRIEAKKLMKELDKTGYERVRIVHVLSNY